MEANRSGEEEACFYHGDLCGSREQSRAHSLSCLDLSAAHEHTGSNFAEMKQSVRSKHLGGAAWITDGAGRPAQHLQYLPFGRLFVDQHPSGYQERYTFTGKELDTETGYGYFGARYMDFDLLTGWLSVDPMADKYPGISPYAYCAWNPVKLVDPDGEDIYRLDVSSGSLKLYQKTKDKTDKIIAGSCIGIGRAKVFKETGSITFSKGIFDGVNGKDYSKNGFTSIGGNQEEAIDVAKFISYNTHIEVSGAGFTSKEGIEDAQIFGWSGNTLTTSNNPENYSAPNEGTTNFHFHTHPENKIPTN